MTKLFETYYIYSLLLENYLQDIELDDLINKLYEKTKKDSDPFPAVPEDPRDPRPWYPREPWVLPENNTFNKCPTCGIDLSATMCYTCINPRCPTGMGPVMCKA